MTGERYWAQRAEKRLWEALAEAEEAANDVAKAYRASARYLQQEARRVMRTFARKSGLTEREALRILKLAGSGDLRAIKKALARMSANPSVKELETILSSPAYAARIKRFESLLSDVQKQTVNLRQLQAEAVRRTLVDTVAGTYYKTIFDLQQRSGAAFSFDAVSPQYIETILDEKIAGKNYSERIWRNTDKLAQKLREQLLMDAMTGASEAKSARRLAETMHASVADARRLIRTETTRAANNASLESFKRCRIKRYQFVATLDLRTSELCAALDGKEFDVAEAKTGVNMPPMHPYCRSVIVTALTAQERARLQRAALDPKTGKSIMVPADMTYKEWYEQYVKDMSGAEGAIKAARNKNADRRQYEKYRAVLGSKAPKSLEKFQQIKYNSSEWEALKSAYLSKIRRSGNTSGKVAVTQERIDAIVNGKLSGVNFTVQPQYNAKIRSYGKTTVSLYSWGAVNPKSVKIEIGKQRNDSDKELIDTLLHEELEARIWIRNTKKFKKLSEATEDKRHAYIYKVIKRFMGMKGW